MTNGTTGKLICAKKIAGETAAKLIQDGMLVGLGSGSTSAYFIAALSQRCRDGLKIHAVASSSISHKLAQNGNIPLVDPNKLTWLDITVDGADAVDPQKRLIKGGGGALLREKIIAKMSKDVVIIIDDTKLVSSLGALPLPVEILPFAYKATLHHIESLGLKGKLRQDDAGKHYITDNGNFIIDIFFESPIQAPETLEMALTAIPGVIETGFFIKIADKIIVGYNDGRVNVIN